MKKLIAQIAAVLMLVTGFSFAGQAAFAQPAHAASMLNCRLVDAGYGYKIYLGSSSGRYATSCYKDYTLGEEIMFWWFAKDGWVLVNAREQRCDTQYRVGC